YLNCKVRTAWMSSCRCTRCSSSSTRFNRASILSSLVMGFLQRVRSAGRGRSQQVIQIVGELHVLARQGVVFAGGQIGAALSTAIQIRVAAFLILLGT